MRIEKRYNLLLEVLIALMIVALAALPLIYPHVAIMREQNKLLKTAELDHFVNGFYADQIVQLYRNQVPWEQIEGKKYIPISQEVLNQASLPFRGRYHYALLRTKPREPVDTTYHLVKLTLEFWPLALPETASEEVKKENQLTFTYEIYIERKYEKNSKEV